MISAFRLQRSILHPFQLVRCEQRSAGNGEILFQPLQRKQSVSFCAG